VSYQTTQNPAHLRTFSVQNFTVADPAPTAFAEWIVPDNTRAELLYWEMVVNSAQPLPAYPYLQGVQSMATVYRAHSTVPAPVLSTWLYKWAIDFSNTIDLSAASIILNPLAKGVILDAGSSVIGYLTHPGGATQISSIRLRCKIWTLGGD